jgi:hypothetical protein
MEDRKGKDKDKARLICATEDVEGRAQKARRREGAEKRRRGEEKEGTGGVAMSDERIITVFGSSRPKESDADYAEARELGRLLADRGFAICSGGYGGVMEAVSRGAKDVGGKTYGVTAEFFERDANDWIDVEVRMKTWEERLFELIRLADGFVACKGGTGTLVELAVVWEMLNKSVMPAKPFIVMGDFWTPILMRVREVEQALGPSTEVPKWGEAKGNLVQTAETPEKVARYFLKEFRKVN